jgi:hypothetical protein
MESPNTNSFVESEDDFDDFNEFVGHDDVVPFGDASATQVGHDTNVTLAASVGTTSSETPNLIRFDDATFEDFVAFEHKLDMFLEVVFPPSAPNAAADPNPSQQMLSQRSQSIFEQLALVPHLKPPNWVRLKIRRHLLTKLGVPVNLDEILPSPMHDASRSQLSSTSTSVRYRRKSLVSEADIHWDGLNIPALEELHLEASRIQHLHDSTTGTLSTIEMDNLDHSSTQKLLAASDEEIDKLLQHYQANYAKLIELSSVWQNQLAEVKKDYEIYESVVQNLVGHTQRLQRQQILANLKKVKSKKRI